MFNAILLQTSSDQVSPLHLLNIMSIDGNSPALQNFFILSGGFLSMTLTSPQKGQCTFQLNSLLSSDRKDILKRSLVLLVSIEDEDFLKEVVKSHLQFLRTRTYGTLDQTILQGILSAYTSSAFTVFDQTI